MAPILGGVSCSTGPDGEKLYPTSGRILYKDQPAAGAMVTFHPKNAQSQLTVHRPYGVAKDDGTFTLTTNKNEGAPAGEYVVTVVWYEAPPARKAKGISTGGEDNPAVDKLKGEYAERAKSKLGMAIKAGSNQLEPIVLK